MKNMFTSPK